MTPWNETFKTGWFRILAACGALSICLYLLVRWLSFDFLYGVDHAHRPIIWVLALFGVATAIYLSILAIVIHRKSDFLQNPQLDRQWFWTIVAFGVVFRIVMMDSNPIQEIDYYRYLWDGRVLANGDNPYRYSPLQIDRFASQAPPESELARLGGLSRTSPQVKTIFRRVHHRHVPTVYPPAAQVVFAVSAKLTPASAPMWLHLMVLRGLLFLFDIGTFLILALLLRHLKLPMCWSVAYGWCPLVMKEFSNSAHLDAIAVFCTTSAIYLIVRAVPPLAAKRMLFAIGAMALLGVGVLSKSYPIILTPLFAVFLFRHFRWRSLAQVAICVGVIFTGYAAFSRHGPLGGEPASATPQADANHSFTGLKTFLTQWQMNDLLFMIVHENLRVPREATDHPFVIAPYEWRVKLSNTLWESGWVDRTHDPAFLVTFAVMALVLIGLAGYFAVRVALQPTPEQFLNAAFLTLIWGWLLSAAQNPWYLIWALPLMLFAQRRSWFLLTGFAFIYYLRFWLEYQNLGDRNALGEAMNRFDFYWVWLEYVPVFAALLLYPTRLKLSAFSQFPQKPEA